MDTQKLVLCFSLFLLSLLTGYQGVGGSSHHHHHHHHHHHTHHHLYGFKPSKLFVFGDSYADTGNIKKNEANSWKYPYGITFPGKPVGRFSDGRVFTDYLAKFVGVKSPIPYKLRKFGGSRLRYGMNFAYGGSGVFKTLVALPNMTTQINFFQQLIHDAVYNSSDLHSSVALVTLSGNDYSAFLARNGTAQGLLTFIPRVVNQLALNLKRVHGTGVKKIAVTNLQPLGCLPQSTVLSGFQQCNGTENTAVNYHNLLLKQAVAKLNNETKDSAFLIIDLYASFMSVFKNKGEHPGSTEFANPLKPCCFGKTKDDSCGSVDENGAMKYTVCDDPQSTFFWDSVHPTQAGWHAVYTALQATLEEL